MFRNYLRSEKQYYSHHLKWIQKLPGLVRVVVPDPTNQSKGYVVVYSEKTRSYEAVAFDIESSRILWRSSVINGGYGTPAIANNTLVLPTKFTDIVALSTTSGKKLWDVKTKCRVRSSINHFDGHFYFSSGGTIYKVSETGDIINKWVLDGAFFYGTIDLVNGLIISLGTQEDSDEESIIRVFAFHPNGQLAYSIPISNSPVISSDTSGIIHDGKNGFVGGEGQIRCFDLVSGKTIWVTNIEGFACRQVCTIDNDRVYYCTLSGTIGALDRKKGTQIWQISVKDPSVTTPVSIRGNHLLALADAHLNVFQTENGQLIDRFSVGHSPYSMISMTNDYGLIGAGEPPHNGLLLAFEFSNSANSRTKRCHCSVHTSNAIVESNFFDIVVRITNTEEQITSAQIDASLFGTSEHIEGKKITCDTFSFRLPIPATICSGDYVMPIFLNFISKKKSASTVCISLSRKYPLPQKVSLNSIPEVVQEQPTYSGAAIGALLKKLHGEPIEQHQIRDMVDFSLQESGYEPFQVWRIILRRILTSSAHCKEDLPEYRSLKIRKPH